MTDVTAGDEVTEVETTVVTMVFEAADIENLVGVLSKYVVMTRQEPGCRNVDLCASATTHGRLVIIQKWESPAAQRAHFDAPVMLDMADACRGLLTQPPTIDLLDGLSAHDLA